MSGAGPSHDRAEDNLKVQHIASLNKHATQELLSKELVIDVLQADTVALRDLQLASLTADSANIGTLNAVSVTTEILNGGLLTNDSKLAALQPPIFFPLPPTTVISSSAILLGNIVYFQLTFSTSLQLNPPPAPPLIIGTLDPRLAPFLPDLTKILTSEGGQLAFLKINGITVSVQTASEVILPNTVLGGTMSYEVANMSTVV